MKLFTKKTERIETLGIRPVLFSASEERLAKFIEMRLESGADKEAIDRRIWELFGEEWSIMFTDLAGFSRNVDKFGIIHFLQTIYESERLLIPIIDDYDGILLDLEGDSLLAIFRQPDKALQAAIDMQHTLEKYNQDKSAEEQVLLCVGIGFGKVLKIGDSRVCGAEVNAASKLGEDIAKAEEILVTEAVKNALKNFPGVLFTPIDEIPSGAKKAYKVIYSPA